MTATQALLTTAEKSQQVLTDCERLAARGGVTQWEAAALRTKAEEALCAARELEQRVAGVEPAKRGDA